MGKILLVDKPKGISSFDVCYKLRRTFNTKKIGHTGTLDPNASGLMIVLVDNATKVNQFLVTATKEYIATVEIGIKTDTLDVDGTIIEVKDEIMPDREVIKNTLNSFIGKSLQTPPMTSAIQVKGKRLYQYQKEGIEVEIPKREVEIFNIDLLEVNEKTFVFKCKVSSGTYVRTLVNDCLNKLGIIGTVKDLRRTKIDNFDVADAKTLEDTINNNYYEISTYECLKDYYFEIEVENRKDIICGKPLKFDLNEEYIMCTNNNEVLAIYHKENGLYRCLRGLL